MFTDALRRGQTRSDEVKSGQMRSDAAKSRHLSLEDLGLSLRIRNALRVGRDIRTIEELCRLGPEEIVRLPGLSSVSLEQIKQALAEKGYWLGKFRADGSPRLPGSDPS